MPSYFTELSRFVVHHYPPASEPKAFLCCDSRGFCPFSVMSLYHVLEHASERIDSKRRTFKLLLTWFQAFDVNSKIERRFIGHHVMAAILQRFLFFLVLTSLIVRPKMHLHLRRLPINGHYSEQQTNQVHSAKFEKARILTLTSLLDIHMTTRVIRKIRHSVPGCSGRIDSMSVLQCSSR